MKKKSVLSLLLAAALALSLAGCAGQGQPGGNEPVVNSDGTIGSSTGVLEDTRHNSAWAAYKSTPKETPTPEVSETPELPESTETPAPGVTPDPGATSAPPGGGGGETTAPTATPSVGLEGPTDDEPAAPEPTPTPDSGAESGPPEGIPII